MLEEINQTLNENLGRVKNLITRYAEFYGQGRRTVKESDILRGAVVLLHAGMEEYLRSLLIWKIDTFDNFILNQYGLPDGKKRSETKIQLGDLTKYRGKKVDDVITECVRHHINEFQTFNDLGDIKKALKQCGIPAKKVDRYDFRPLPELIKRRHNIVHRSDRNEAAGGQGNHRTKSLAKITVENYLESVWELRNFVTRNLE